LKVKVSDRVRGILAEYVVSNGDSMDPVMSSIVELIDTRVIGHDEQSNESNAVMRNEMRRLQRHILTTDEDGSLKLPIALCLDDYKNYLSKPEDDRVARMTVDTTSGLIIDAIEKYLLPKGREVLAKTSHGPVEAALIPLFKRQLKELGIV
jgi:hypothetical protein